MQYFIYACTETGNFRDKNEDSVLAADKVINFGEYCTVKEQPFTVAVCDGVGGEKSGEIASMMAAQGLLQCGALPEDELKEKILQLHSEIKQYGLDNADSTGLQTTMCCLLVTREGELVCFNVGDSRLYLYSGGSARQVSKDHSLVRLMFENGEIDESELYSHPQKNIIFSSLGTPSGTPAVDVIRAADRLGESDAAILCSDGVSDYVGCMEIEAAMSLDIPFSEKVKALAELALERGSSDNLSVVGVAVNGGDLVNNNRKEDN